MSPLELAALELQLASIAGKCDRHCAVLQHVILKGSGLMLRGREFSQKERSREGDQHDLGTGICTGRLLKRAHRVNTIN